MRGRFPRALPWAIEWCPVGAVVGVVEAMGEKGWRWEMQIHEEGAFGGGQNDAPSGLMLGFACVPGRCPGLSNGAPLGLLEGDRGWENEVVERGRLKEGCRRMAL
jgi:hypothetical protein